MNRADKVNYISFGDFQLNLADGILLQGGSPVPLSPKEFETLRLLVERSPRLVSKEEFVSRIWPDTFVGDSSLARNISVLRKLLGDGLIETVAKRGYRFTQAVHENSGFEIAPEPGVNWLKQQAEASLPSPDRSTSVPAVERVLVQAPRKWKLLSAAGLITFVIGIVTLWRVAFTTSQPVDAPELKQRQLTSNLVDNPILSSAISPDSKYLAYTDKSGMHVQLVAGVETLNIARPEDSDEDASWMIAAWFPDSTKFLVNEVKPGFELASPTASIWIVSVLGAEPRRLREHASASAISPAGTQIAFTTAPGPLGDREVWLMSSNGQGAHLLFSVGSESALSRVQWSPDGQRLAYLRFSPAVTNHYRPAVALEIRREGGSTTTLIRDTGLLDFSWLADGSILYALCSGVLTSVNCNLFESTLNRRTDKVDGSPRRLTNWAGFGITFLSATSDARLVVLRKESVRAFVQVGELTQGPKLSYLRNLSNRSGVDLPYGWTKDSKEVVFTSDRNGHFEIYKQRLDSKTAIKIADGIGPRVSPDGQWVIYQTAYGQSHEGVPLMRVPTSGGEPEQILVARSYGVHSCALEKGTFCAFGEMTQDGKKLVIYKLDPVKGRGDELAQFSIDPNADYGWSVSPNGLQIAVAKSGSNELRFISLASGATRQLNVAGHIGITGLDWSGDNNGVFVSSADASGVTLLFVDLNGIPRVLLRKPGGFVTWAIAAPDRRHVALCEYDTTANVWLVEGLDHARN